MVQEAVRRKLSLSLRRTCSWLWRSKRSLSDYFGLVMDEQRMNITAYLPIFDRDREISDHDLVIPLSIISPFIIPSFIIPFFQAHIFQPK